MEYIVFVPAICSIVLAVTFFLKSEKAEDFVEKFWIFVLGVLFGVFSIFFTKIGIEEVKKFKTYYYETHANDYHVY